MTQTKQEIHDTEKLLSVLNDEMNEIEHHSHQVELDMKDTQKNLDEIKLEKKRLQVSVD